MMYIIPAVCGNSILFVIFSEKLKMSLIIIIIHFYLQYIAVFINI